MVSLECGCVKCKIKVESCILIKFGMEVHPGDDVNSMLKYIHQDSGPFGSQLHSRIDLSLIFGSQICLSELMYYYL